VNATDRGEYPTTPVRLDAALVARGLARSRAVAARYVTDGLVTVDGRPVVKAAAPVRRDQLVEVAALDHYVSRAAHKLVAALDGFAVPVEGRRALDVGASTGGFTQVLLERGVSAVLAVDVGHGQLSPSLRSDGRVAVVEGYNARSMTRGSLEAAARLRLPAHEAVASLVVADLSFISLTLVLPAVASTVGPDADYVLLVKPQFEVGRTGIREGIVRLPGLRAEAVERVLWAAWDAGLPTAGILSSPIAGTAGNHEYLVHLNRAHGRDPSQWLQRVTALAAST